MVAGDQHHPLDPGPAQGAQGARAVGAHRIVQDQGARDFAVDCHEHARGALERGPPAHSADAGGEHPVLLEKGELADGYPAALDLPLDSLAGPLRHLFGEGEREPAVTRRPHHGRGKHVLGHLVQGGGQAQDLRDGLAAEGLDVGEGGHPRRLAAGEHQGDHGAGQVLAKSQRSRHRQEGDEVHPELAAPQVPGHGERQRDEDHGGRDCPQDLGEATGPGEPGQATREDAGEGDPREEAARLRDGDGHAHTVARVSSET